MKKSKIIYSIALLFILLSLSCKKADNGAPNSSGNSGGNIILPPPPFIPPIANNTYLVNAQFEKPYYLNTTGDDAIATVNVNFQYTQNTEIVNSMPITYALYADPAFLNFIQSDSLTIEQGNANFNIDIKKYPEGYMVFYLQIIFANTTIFTTNLPVYKLSEFHTFSNFYTPGAKVTFPISTYSKPGNLMATANFSGLPLSAGSYPIKYEIKISNRTYTSSPLCIMVEPDGTATMTLNLTGIPKDDLTILFAIRYQGNYIWVKGPVLTII